MRYLKWILLLAVLAPFAIAQDVRYNFDPTVDFSKFKTYRWERHPDSQQVDQLTERQLIQAFDTELATKGLTETADNPDLVIVFQIATRDQAEITTWDTGWGYGPGWRGGWYGGGGGMATTTVDRITVGTLDLDMFDAHNKELVWRGVASKELDLKASPQKRQKNMRKAAQKLLKHYPPKQK